MGKEEKSRGHQKVPEKAEHNDAVIPMQGNFPTTKRTFGSVYRHF